MAYKHVHVDILLKPFRFWCQKVLPLVYDDSLSYYEVLCKLTKYINELIENLKLISDAFDEIQDEFDDMKEQFDAIVEYYENIQNLINQFRTELNGVESDVENLSSDFNDLKTWVEGQVETLTTAISQIPIITVDDALSSTSTNPVQNKVITEALQGVTPMTVDSALSTSSTNPVQNKVITQAIQGLTPITVDDALSTSSENPVQNKVITNAINAIPVITVDDAMSQSSENPVQNKVIYNALGNIAQSLGSSIASLTERVSMLERGDNVIKRLGTFTFDSINGVTTGTIDISRTQASLPDDIVAINQLGQRWWNTDYDIFISWTCEYQGTAQPSVMSIGLERVSQPVPLSDGIFTFRFLYSCNCNVVNATITVNVFYARHVT